MDLSQDQPLKPNESPAPSPIRSSPLWIWAVIPVILTFLFYLPVLNHSFVNWDDPPMVVNNPHIRGLSLDSIKDMFTSFYAADWVPLTWLSLAVDFKLGNLNPSIFHFDNLLLHCLNTTLVFLVALGVLSHKGVGQEADGGQAPWVVPASFLAALGFGLHPLHVESVAWASERKDLLYSFFYLLSLWVNLKFSSSPLWMPWKYLACLGLFLLSLLAKTMAATLPLVLLSLDLWPLGRFQTAPRKVLLEKVPFFLAAFLTGGLTLLAQSQANALLSTETIPWDYRIMNAFHSAALYLFKILFPTGLAAFYPIQFQRTYSFGYLISALMVILVSIACFVYRVKRPYLASAWFFYLLTFSPVLGIVHTGGQAVMDHYAYLAILGPLLLLASVAATVLFKFRALFILVIALLTGFMGMGTFHQDATWKDSVDLWENVLRVDEPNIQDIAYERLADAYISEGRWDDALKTVDDSAVMAPGNEFQPARSVDSTQGTENRDFALKASLYALKGVALMGKNMIPEASKEFERDVFLEPQNAMGHRLLSYTYEKMGRHEDALKEILEAIGLNPQLPGMNKSLGVIYFSMRKFDRAVEAFQKARLEDPQSLECLLNLAGAYSLAGRSGEAIQTLKEAIALQPQNPDLYQRLGQAYEKTGDKASAAEAFNACKRFK